MKPAGGGSPRGEVPGDDDNHRRGRRWDQYVYANMLCRVRTRGACQHWSNVVYGHGGPCTPENGRGSNNIR